MAGRQLSADLFLQFGDELDRDRALRLLASLSESFPGSAYARQAAPLEHRLQEARPAPAAAPAAAPALLSTGRAAAPRTAPAAIDTNARQPRDAAVSRAPAAAPGAPREPPLVTLAAVRRERLPDAVRVTIELDREVPYYSERIPGPDRVFVDLPRTRAVPTLKAAMLPFPDDVVRRVRVGAQPGSATRVVLDLDDSGRHSVYTLYNPYRIVIDVERVRPDAGRAPPPAARPAAKPALAAIATPVPAAPIVSTPVLSPSAPVPAPAAAIAADSPSPVPSGPLVAVVEPSPPTPPARVRPAASRPVPDRAVAARAASAAAILAAPSSPAPDAPPPAVPAVNTRGGFSLARQLGLGVARVVIDAGHGGHDPGARGKGLSEADLTLDIALRLEKLLLRQPGVEVVQTRRTNAYVALEERTDIANRSGADLFLSIHANASADRRARGVETYFLSFAPNPEAEAIAARENAGSTRPMRQLPDLLRAIALNNKLDESRDLAGMVQQALYAQVRKSDKRARNLGVKQAPFMVLVGATMPSVLTEISFVTNQQDAGLLATEKYRQQIAEALLAGITRYQQSLKKGVAVAAQ